MGNRDNLSSKPFLLVLMILRGLQRERERERDRERQRQRQKLKIAVMGQLLWLT